MKHCFILSISFCFCCICIHISSFLHCLRNCMQLLFFRTLPYWCRMQSSPRLRSVGFIRYLRCRSSTCTTSYVSISYSSLLTILAMYDLNVRCRSSREKDRQQFIMRCIELGWTTIAWNVTGGFPSIASLLRFLSRFLSSMSSLLLHSIWEAKCIKH